MPHRTACYSVTINLLIIPLVVQCIHLHTFHQTQHKLSKQERTVIQIENSKPFRNENFFLCRRLDSLKLWKKRRRVMNYINKFCDKSDDYMVLRSKRRAIESEEGYDLEFGTTLPSDVTVGLRAPLPTSSLYVIAKFKERWPVQSWKRYGLFHDEYLLMVNTHWLHFPPPAPSAYYAFGGFYIFMTAVGCLGNALVLLMYFRCRSLRTPGNILVANLALSDFMMLAKTPIFIFNSFNLGPALGKPGCVIYGFLGGLTGTTSIATLSAIALDRYWAVVRPLEPLRSLTAIRARLLAVGAWIYAGIFSIIPALDIGYGHYVPEGYLTSCSFDYLTDEDPPRYFIFVFFCAAWLAPFCTISFCYLSIFRVVTVNQGYGTNNQENRLSSRHVKEQVKRKAEIKLAFLVIVVIALFFVSWTPYAIVALLGIFGKKDLITPITSMIPALFCKTAACINPFIYIITHPKFRKEFKKLLFRDKSKHMGGTMKTIGYTEATKVHRPSKDFSDTEVEEVEMKDIPYQNAGVRESPEGNVKTVSSKITQRENSERSLSMKSFEENVVSPPSWYAKPKFAKKKSFSRRSSRSVASSDTEIL